MNIANEISVLKKELNVLIAAHYYQRDEVFYAADITGDSLELARKCMEASEETVVFLRRRIYGAKCQDTLSGQESFYASPCLLFYG